MQLAGTMSGGEQAMASNGRRGIARSRDQAIALEGNFDSDSVS